MDKIAIALKRIADSLEVISDKEKEKLNDDD